MYAAALERLGQIGAAERALDAALAAARGAGDPRLANTILAEAPPAALWGPSPVTRASGRCLDVVRVLRITSGAPAVESVALRCQAVLEALRGRVDAARRMIGSARRTVEQLGLTHRRLETEVAAGLHRAARRRSRRGRDLISAIAYEELRDRGLDGEAAQAGAFLGRALLMQGRVDEADEVAAEAERLAGADLKAGIAWRDVRAEAAVTAGRHDDRAGARTRGRRTRVGDRRAAARRRRPPHARHRAPRRRRHRCRRRRGAPRGRRVRSQRDHGPSHEHPRCRAHP